MPWRETCAMNERMRFIVAAEAGMEVARPTVKTANRCRIWVFISFVGADSRESEQVMVSVPRRNHGLPGHRMASLSR